MSFATSLASMLYRMKEARPRVGLIQRIQGRASAIAWKALTATRICGADPVVRVPLGDREIYLNASHRLPSLLRRPYYDRLLPRLARFLEQQQGRLVMIDVGANVGDTVTLVQNVVDGEFLCVEPNPAFYPLLVQNTRLLSKVTCVNALVAPTSGGRVSALQLKSVEGTAYLNVDAEADSAATAGDDDVPPVVSIDQLVEQHPIFTRTNLFKIDTDGYDFNVLLSAERLIQSQKPILYFEYSPWHLLHVGKNDPFEALSTIMSWGYAKAIFYDSEGYLFMTASHDEVPKIHDAIAYARRKAFYYDVLLFPDEQSDGRELFHEQELQVFPEYKWY